ncbi:MAG: mevalonate kinase [Candidatus Helarchaeota archaeon]|nr:mevalonate kinase [Candidatus Helarchaeota archaeon]
MTGEHAVVYDAAAVVIAIDLRALTKIQAKSDSSFTFYLKDYNFKETISDISQNPKNNQITPIWQIIKTIYNRYHLTSGLNIEVWSDIPIGVGLGSSAAITVATTAALNSLFDLKLGLDAISSIAYEGEKITHGTPSGIDNSISTYGGAILFKKGKISHIEIPYEFPLLIVNSGISRSTKVQVENVRNLYKAYPSIFKHVFQAINAISVKAENTLRFPNIKKLGDLLTYNQQLLQVLGVSRRELDDLIEILISNGALGAKLTGAGGGGCLIALFESINSKDRCVSALKSKKVEYYDTSLSEYGVKPEHILK